MAVHTQEPPRKPKAYRPVSETRKVRKPLMERKRRERINSSLEQLALLLKEAKLVAADKPVAKLEKADILELTVRHLKSVQSTAAVVRPEREEISTRESNSENNLDENSVESKENLHVPHEIPECEAHGDSLNGRSLTVMHRGDYLQVQNPRNRPTSSNHTPCTNFESFPKIGSVDWLGKGCLTSSISVLPSSRVDSQFESKKQSLNDSKIHHSDKTHRIDETPMVGGSGSSGDRRSDINSFSVSCASAENYFTVIKSESSSAIPKTNEDLSSSRVITPNTSRVLTPLHTDIDANTVFPNTKFSSSVAGTPAKDGDQGYVTGFLKCLSTVESLLNKHQTKEMVPIEGRLMDHLTKCLKELPIERKLFESNVAQQVQSSKRQDSPVSRNDDNNQFLYSNTQTSNGKSFPNDSLTPQGFIFCPSSNSNFGSNNISNDPMCPPPIDKSVTFSSVDESSPGLRDNSSGQISPTPSCSHLFHGQRRLAASVPPKSEATFMIDQTDSLKRPSSTGNIELSDFSGVNFKTPPLNHTSFYSNVDSSELSPKSFCSRDCILSNSDNSSSFSDVDKTSLSYNTLQNNRESFTFCALENREKLSSTNSSVMSESYRTCSQLEYFEQDNNNEQTSNSSAQINKSSVQTMISNDLQQKILSNYRHITGNDTTTTNSIGILTPSMSVLDALNPEPHFCGRAQKQPSIHFLPNRASITEKNNTSGFQLSTISSTQQGSVTLRGDVAEARVPVTDASTRPLASDSEVTSLLSESSVSPNEGAQLLYNLQRAENDPALIDAGRNPMKRKRISVSDSLGDDEHALKNFKPNVANPSQFSREISQTLSDRIPSIKVPELASLNILRNDTVNCNEERNTPSKSNSCAPQQLVPTSLDVCKNVNASEIEAVKLRTGLNTYGHSFPNSSSCLLALQSKSEVQRKHSLKSYSSASNQFPQSSSSLKNSSSSLKSMVCSMSSVSLSSNNSTSLSSPSREHLTLASIAPSIAETRVRKPLQAIENVLSQPSSSKLINRKFTNASHNYPPVIFPSQKLRHLVNGKPSEVQLKTRKHFNSAGPLNPLSGEQNLSNKARGNAMDLSKRDRQLSAIQNYQERNDENLPRIADVNIGARFDPESQSMWRPW